MIEFFFEKKIYFHKTNLQKNHTYNTIHTIYKRKKIKAKKRLEILKKEEKEMGVAIMSFKQSRVRTQNNLLRKVINTFAQYLKKEGVL